MTQLFEKADEHGVDVNFDMCETDKSLIMRLSWKHYRKNIAYGPEYALIPEEHFELILLGDLKTFIEKCEQEEFEAGMERIRRSRYYQSSAAIKIIPFL